MLQIVGSYWQSPAFSNDAENMGKSTKEQVLQMVRKAGVLRPRELDARGIPREYLHACARKDGLNVLAGEFTSWQTRTG